MRPATTLAESLLHALAARGARAVFGIPGDFALPLFREIERCGVLPLHTLSHEPGVGFAADGAARAAGGLGVAAVTYGAGALNLVNAVASAYAERVPLVVLSGAPGAAERAGGRLLHHQVKTLDSQWKVFEELTVDQARLDDAAMAPAAIARVLDNAVRHSRPVLLELPRDMMTVPCAAVPPPAPAMPPSDAVAAAADEVLLCLRRARSAALLVGVEVRRFGLEDRVAEFARRLGLPVFTTFMGRGLLSGPGQGPVAGTYLGAAGCPEVAARVESAEALLLLGVIDSDTNFGAAARPIDPRRVLHAFDRQVTIGNRLYPEVPLASLVDALLERLPPHPDEALLAVPAPVRRHAAAEDDAPLTPAAIAEAIDECMLRHGSLPIACDIGDCLFTAMGLQPTALIAPGYYATMGYGVPAGLGLQAATGRRPLILVGDGAFQMTGWELGNAARHGWDPIVIVFNNAGWEMLRAFSPASAFNDLSRWDFAAMAPGMGGEGVAVASRGALAEALDHAWTRRGRFQLIDARLPRGVRSPTLDRFVRAMGRQSQPA
jgi:indolepyruvate decarboxylase